MSFQPPQPSQGFLGSFLNELTQQTPSLSNQLSQMGQQRRQSAAKQQSELSKIRNQSYKDLESISKFYDTKLSPEEKERFLPFFTQAQMQGVPIDQAFEFAEQQYLQAYPEKSTQQQRQEAFEKKSPITKAFRRDVPLTERRRRDIEERQRLYEEGASPLKMPGQFFTGASKSPLGNLLNSFTNPEQAVAKSLKGGVSSIFKPSLPTREATTEKERKTQELGKGLADLAVFEATPLGKALAEVGGLGFRAIMKTPIGKKAAEFLRVFGNKFGKKAAQEIVKDSLDAANIVEGSGIPTAQQQTAFYESLKGKVKQRSPTSKEARLAQEEFPKVASQKESQDIIGAQKYLYEKEGTKELSKKEVKRYEKSKAEKEPKTHDQLLDQTQRKKQASAKVEPSKEEYLKTTKERRALEDDLKSGKSKNPKEDISKRRELLKREEELFDNYRKNLYESETGTPYRKGLTAEKDAQNAIKKIKELAESDTKLTQEVLRGKGWKPETIKKAVEDIERVTLVGKPAPTSFSEIHEAYAEAYLKELSKVQNKLSSSKFITPQEYINLSRTRDILQDRLEINLIKIGQDLQRRTLREIEKRANLWDSISYKNKEIESLLKKPETLKKIVRMANSDPSGEAAQALESVIGEKGKGFFKNINENFLKKRSPAPVNALIKKTGIHPYSPAGRLLKSISFMVLGYLGIPYTAKSIFRKVTGSSKGESFKKRLRRKQNVK